MSPQQRWARIQELCEEIEERGDYSPAALISSEPSEEIRKEALALAMAARAERNFTFAEDPKPSRVIPSQIGPYRILAFLGEGGTGTVYSAVHGEKEHALPVAVKLLHPHLNQGDTLARFRREYAILTRLNHSNLVRVLDGGEDDGGEGQSGRSYLVMELAEGLPIDQYCDANLLDVEARVRLFIGAAEAMQVAHENLVVHLDLKPSNLVVTAAGQLKVLDFGTAKLLDITSIRTQQLTPSYASPEQLRGDPVTPRSDVYSLGLIIYDVISGGKAFGDRSTLAGLALRAAGDATLQPIAKYTTETNAKLRSSSPRRLKRIVERDLGAIISKALEHVAAERYASMAELAADLGRFLANKPVSAQPLTLAYRARKFAARHPRSLSAVAVGVLLIASLGAYGLAQWRRAEVASAKASGAARSMEFLVLSGVPLTGGRKDISFADVLVRASQRLESEPGLTWTERAVSQSGIATVLDAVDRPAEALKAANMAMDWALRGEAPGTVVHAASVAMSIRMANGDCKGAVTAMEQGTDAYRGGAALPVSLRVGFLQGRGQVRSICRNDPQGQMADLGSAFEMMGQYERDPSVPKEMLPFRIANIYGGYAYSLAGAKQYGKAREVAEAGLKYTASHPELRASSSLLHRILSTAEYAAHNLEKSAVEMEAATSLAEGSTSEFEVLRDRMTWASRMAEAGHPAGALRLIEESMKRLRSNSGQVGAQRWMVFIDAAMAYQRSGNCGPVPGLLGEVDDLLPNGIASPVWRGNRLAAEALCLSAEGRVDEARMKARESLTTVNLPEGSAPRLLLEAAAK